jgi:hypothetical protein
MTKMDELIASGVVSRGKYEMEPHIIGAIEDELYKVHGTDTFVSPGRSMLDELS